MPRVGALGHGRQQAGAGLAGDRVAQVRGRLRCRETRLMCAPGDLGKATTMPGCRPTPSSSSVPCVETWCGLPLQWAAGTQLTPVMRTLVTCGELVFALPCSCCGCPSWSCRRPPGCRRRSPRRRGGRERRAGPAAPRRLPWRAASPRAGRFEIACGRLCSPRRRAPSRGTTLGPAARDPRPAGGPRRYRLWLRKPQWHGSCAAVPFRRAFSAPAEAGARRAPAPAGWTAARRAGRAG